VHLRLDGVTIESAQPPHLSPRITGPPGRFFGSANHFGDDRQVWPEGQAKFGGVGRALSEPDLKEFSERLRLAVERAGGKTYVCQRSGVPDRSLTNYLAATTEPKAFALAAIAEACSVSVEWLTGRSDPPNMADTLGDGFSFVRRYDVRASAGPGAMVPYEDIDGSAQFVAFRTEWLHRIGVSSAHAEVLIAVGDSMEPTIRDGDLLLIDRGIDRVVDNGIYVLVLGGMVLVKRVQTRRDGSVVLLSDNQRYENEAVPAAELPDLKVEGRVRWFGRTI
jgi:SOS-response transcriptional repressor LexA